MGWGLQFILAFVISLAIVGILGLVLLRPVINLVADSFIKRLMKDPYPENIGEMYNVFAKVGVQNVFESDLRGTTGEPLQRPFGTSKHFSQWDKLLLNPVYLSRQPVVEAVAIDTKVVLGPQAKRPMEIGIPILIAGMGYGFGVSLKAKIALAKGADLVNTATNTGIGPFLPEERKHTKRLIIQYHRGGWGKEEEVLRQANAVEIQLGYGALGSAPVTLKPPDISPEFRDYLNLRPDQSLTLGAVFPGLNNGADLAKLVERLRVVTNGVPIGVKIGATHFLEKELEIITGAKVDFLTIDGAEAGINFGPGILADDTGLPTLPALCRTVDFLKKKGVRGKVSLIVSGGLVTPGQFLKALALGADAVAIGTIALVALAHTQNVKVLPWEPPTELLYERGKSKQKLSVDNGAKNVANFLKSCDQEIVMAMRSLGRTSLAQLSSGDLCALSPEMAEMTGTELGLFTPVKNLQQKNG